LSFDRDEYGGSNVYLPLILLSLDWFGSSAAGDSVESRRAGVMVSPQQVSRPKLSDVADRPGFVCAFIGNPEPVRMRAVRELQKIGQVDVYGRAAGNPVAGKAAIARDYKFMLCFENDLFPGYVTEKPLEAWASGCIPLWRGIDSEGMLNTSSHVNAYDHRSLEDFVSEVAVLMENKESLRSMGSEPLFSAEPSLEPVVTALRRVINAAQSVGEGPTPKGKRRVRR